MANSNVTLKRVLSNNNIQLGVLVVVILILIWIIYKHHQSEN